MDGEIFVVLFQAAIAALQAGTLWVLSDLRDRVRRLEDQAMRRHF